MLLISDPDGPSSSTAQRGPWYRFLPGPNVDSEWMVREQHSDQNEILGYAQFKY